MGERLSEGWGREAGRWGKRNEGKEAEEKGGVRECREEPVGRAGGIRKIRASGWRTARLVLVGLAGRRLNHSAKVSLRTVGFWNFGCALGSCCGWAFGLCCFQNLLQRACNWVHSSVVRAADCRSAGPWFKSGCALLDLGFLVSKTFE